MIRRVAAILLMLFVALTVPAPKFSFAEIVDPWERLALNSVCWRGRCIGPEDPGFRSWLAVLDPIVAPITRAAGIDHIHVVGLASQVPNAMATKHVLGLTVGLTELGLGKDEWAFVVAHEVAHMRLKHFDQKIRRLQVAQFIRLLNIAFGDPSLDPAIAAVADIVLAAYSRDQEREADREAVSLTRQAGFDPCGGVRAFVRLAPLGRPNTGDLFDTHPSIQERIETLRTSQGCSIFAQPPAPQAPMPTPGVSQTSPPGSTGPQPATPAPAAPQSPPPARPAQIPLPQILRSDGRVEPGNRIGPVRIGLTEDQFREVVGALRWGHCESGWDRTSDLDGSSQWNVMVCRSGPVAAAWFDKDGMLVRIAITDETFLTKEGIGVGTPLSGIVLTYGDKFRRLPLRAGWSIVYDTLGLDFVVSRSGNNRAVAVGIFRPGVR